MTKTRIQTERPIAKGRHQRWNTRWAVRENPPSGQLWGAKTWPGAGAGVAVTYGAWLWDTGTTTAGMAGGMARANNAVAVSVTHLFLSEAYAAGATGDPIATWANTDPIRLYNANDISQWVEYKITSFTDAGAYRDYTVTFMAFSPSSPGWLPTAAMPVWGLEKTATPQMEEAAYDPGTDTVAGVQTHVDALTLTGDELRAEIQRILDAERANKNRVTLVDWLDAKLGVI